MCDCARSLEELATIINREDPIIDRVYDQDGPYWARGLKKHVIVSLLASNIPRISPLISMFFLVEYSIKLMLSLTL